MLDTQNSLTIYSLHLSYLFHHYYTNTHFRMSLHNFSKYSTEKINENGKSSFFTLTLFSIDKIEILTRLLKYSIILRMGHSRSFFYSREEKHNIRQNMNFIREIIRTYEEFKGGRDFFWLGTPGKVAKKRQHSSQGLTDGIRWKTGHTIWQNSVRKDIETENMFK